MNRLTDLLKKLDPRENKLVLPIIMIAGAIVGLIYFIATTPERIEKMGKPVVTKIQTMPNPHNLIKAYEGFRDLINYENLGERGKRDYDFAQVKIEEAKEFQKRGEYGMAGRLAIDANYLIGNVVVSELRSEFKLSQ